MKTKSLIVGGAFIIALLVAVSASAADTGRINLHIEGMQWGYAQPLPSDDWNRTAVRVNHLEQYFDWYSWSWLDRLRTVAHTPDDCGLNTWPPPPMPSGCADWYGDMIIDGLGLGWHQLEITARGHVVARPWVFVWEGEDGPEEQWLEDVTLQQMPFQVYTSEHLTIIGGNEVTMNICVGNVTYQDQVATSKFQLVGPGKTSLDILVALEYQEIWISGQGWDCRSVTLRPFPAYMKSLTHGSTLRMSAEYVSPKDGAKVMGEAPEVFGAKQQKYPDAGCASEESGQCAPIFFV